MPRSAPTYHIAHRAAPHAHWVILPLYPLFAVFRDLFFPDGHGRLERINGVAAGLERLGAMRAGDHHDDAALADLQPPDAVDDGNVIGLPALFHLGGDGGHPLLGHLWVSIVFEVTDALAARVIAHNTLECDHAAIAGMRRLAHQRPDGRVVQRVAGNLNHCRH